MKFFAYISTTDAVGLFESCRGSFKLMDEFAFPESPIEINGVAFKVPFSLVLLYREGESLFLQLKGDKIDLLKKGIKVIQKSGFFFTSIHIFNGGKESASYGFFNGIPNPNKIIDVTYDLVDEIHDDIFCGYFLKGIDCDRARKKYDAYPALFVDEELVRK